MDKVQIIGVPQSNYVWVVRMACEEKGVPYDIAPVRPHTPEIEALHPLGKIPGMRHGDVSLCESKAIVGYIDRMFPGPKLIPEDARAAAEVEQWVSLVNTSIDPCLVRIYLLAYFFPKTPDGSPDRAVIDGVLPTMQKQIDLLDEAVAKTGYLAAGRFTLADINLLPILYYVQRCPEGGEMVKGATNLAGYYGRHAERASFKASTPPPFAGR
ncbi:MAG TPA: glutathione S-transferase family protein [Xanthobacteraceae bacterium]|jgi:glutathione S-transferase|nr:glutathione S-transferase family protein [Xanthobacteraceae bacterium]